MNDKSLAGPYILEEVLIEEESNEIEDTEE